MTKTNNNASEWNHAKVARHHEESALAEIDGKRGGVPFSRRSLAARTKRAASYQAKANKHWIKALERVLRAFGG